MISTTLLTYIRTLIFKPKNKITAAHNNTPENGVFYFRVGINGELIFGFYTKVHAEENTWTIFGFGSSRR